MKELSEYLDDRTDADIRAKLEKHTSECPNCWVICDTTKKTIKIYKGMDQACSIPEDVHARLMAAVEKKIAAKCSDKTKV